MPQTLITEPKGIYSNPNELSAVPKGAMLTAKNCVLDRDGIIESRRGLKKYGANLSFSTTQKPNRFFDFKDKLILSYKDKLAYDSDGAGTWIDLSGTYSPPGTALTIKSAEANRNIYLTTSAGVKKMESATSTPAAAGCPKALDGQASVIAGTWMTNNTQVAYRIVWGIRDANNNLILGAPSQRIIVINSSGGARDVSVVFTMPSGITTSHFFQIYRSVMSSGVAVDPNDELGLVYEANPTAGEITALSVTVSDITPESLRGAALYTSPSQQGIGQANEQPPMAQDVAAFKGYTLYCNTTSKHRYTLTIVSAGAPGLQLADTITIGGIVYTAGNAELPAVGQFLLSLAGTPAENIETTALSLVRVINTYASNTGVYAYYLSGYNDLPGKMLIEERSIGGASFAVISSRGNAWSPQLPSSGTTQSSSNDQMKNGIAISKNLQPEAVPLLNSLPAGSADQEIQRVIALRDSVFFFKNDGIYRLTGSTISDFSVTLFDNTAHITAPESAVAFNNQVLCMSDQSIIAVSDTGVAVISRPIELSLLELAVLSNFNDNTFGIAYESSRKFILFTVTESTDTFATQAFVYNSFTNAWTGPWEMSRSCGIVKASDDKLYLGSWDQDTPNAYQERKDFTVNDYADEEFVVVITGFSGTVLTMVSTTNITAGDTIKQGNRRAIVESVDSATQITVDRSLSWDGVSETKVYQPIPIEIQFVPDTADNPGIVKQYREVTLFFKEAQFRDISIGFTSNFAPTNEDTEIDAIVQGPWGLFPWGGVPWGGGVPRLQAIRTLVPREKQRCSWLYVKATLSEALSKFALSGYSAVLEAASPRLH